MTRTTIVSGAELEAHLDAADWRIFDCRHQLANPAYGETAYAAGHIANASFLHLDGDLSGPLSGRNGRHPLPDAGVLAAKLGAAGVGANTQVVAYDDAGGMFAARLWWLLRWLGHDRVAVLDRGIDGWIKDGRPLTQAPPRLLPAVFPVSPRALVVSADEVLANLDSNEFCLVDARASDRFRGENETLDPQGGHIPGARNRFFRDNLDGDGSFREAAELRNDYLGLLAGFTPEQAVVYCGSGVTACHDLLAMEIAGLAGARLYAGSWSEWCSDPARPVAR